MFLFKIVLVLVVATFVAVLIFGDASQTLGAFICGLGIIAFYCVAWGMISMFAPSRHKKKDDQK